MDGDTGPNDVQAIGNRAESDALGGRLEVAVRRDWSYGCYRSLSRQISVSELSKCLIPVSTGRRFAASGVR